MKILLATDGSEGSEIAIQEVIRRPWPAGSEVELVSVAEQAPGRNDPAWRIDPYHSKVAAIAKGHLAQRLGRSATQLKQRAPELRISTRLLEGSPKEQLLQEIANWQPDLVVVGSHGHGPVLRFFLGSVALAVAAHAPCSVEIVRSKHPVLHAPSHPQDCTTHE